MNEVAEGLGAAIEGSLTARAVEPDAGEAQLQPSDAIECANCGTVFAGKYCPNCGQKAHIHRTLAAIAHDLIHGVLHLDGKLSHTLPLLVFKPGRLTRRYIDGERAKFVSPMSMFLFSVFSMFAIFQVIGLTVPSDLAPEEDLNAAVSTVRDGAEANAADLEERIAELEGATGEDAQRREELESELAATRTILRNMGVATGVDETEEAASEESATVSEDARGSGRLEGKIGPDGFRLVPADSDTNARISFEESDTGIDFLDKGLAKKWRENPGLMLYKLQANAYKFSWLLIPLSIPFVWLTFAWRRRFKAYDHAIFVTYSLAFMSLLFITVSLLSITPGMAWVAAMLVGFVPPIHLYKQLRHTYSLSRFSAFWRLMVLSIFIWIVMALFLQALLVMGAF